MTKTISKNIYLGFIFLSTACIPKFSCDKLAEDFKNNKTFNLVLHKKYNNYNSRDAYLYGSDIQTGYDTEFYDGTGYIAHNLDKFIVCDTLIKKAGQYSIIIKRGSKTILLPFSCVDKVYKDSI